MTVQEKLGLAIAALERIAESDPGPAYYIARAALEAIRDDDLDPIESES
jgi:hypothetical protein